MSDIIKTIRAEIERRIKRNKEEYAPDGLFEVQDNFAKLLAFLDTLEAEEKEVDFDKEYEKFSNDVDADYPLPIDLDDYKYFARHFYELGLNSKK